MKKGDIVNCRFPFTDLSSSKRRSALVLHEGTQDVMLAFITRQANDILETDLLITPGKVNKLKVNSVIRCSKLATIIKSLVTGKIGELNDATVLKINSRLRLVLKLNQE